MNVFRDSCMQWWLVLLFTYRYCKAIWYKRSAHTSRHIGWGGWWGTHEAETCCSDSFGENVLFWLECHLTESTIKTLIADINECNASVSVCVANATCHNTEGSYFCSCEVGFTGKYCTGESEISLTQIPRLEMRIAHSDSKVN